jgi:hypothetical protein
MRDVFSLRILLNQKTIHITSSFYYIQYDVYYFNNLITLDYNVLLRSYRCTKHGTLKTTKTGVFK